MVGVGLRLWQYAASGSLWLDEIMLSRSIVGFPLGKLLTTPLPYNQIAPKGFLLIEKLNVMAFGRSDAALRLLPLVSSLAALFLFWRVALRLLDRAGPLIATTMFATAVPLIHFGALVKQYSVDVLATLVFIWLALYMRSARIPRRRISYIAIGGAILVWFSQPSILVAGAVGFSSLIFAPSIETEIAASRKQIAVIVCVWAISAVAAILAGRAAMTAMSGAALREYWAEGFPPGTFEGFTATLWPLDRLKWLFGSGRQGSLCYPVPILYIALAIGGLVVLVKKNRPNAAFLIAPIIVAIGAAIARQYPFSNRLLLYLVPIFLLSIAAGVEWIRQRVSAISNPLAAASALMLVAPTVFPVASVPPPYRLENVKPVLAYVAEKRQPGDAIYVYYGAMHAMTFYGPEYGFKSNDYSIGRQHRGNSRCYLEDLDTFRGRPRVWLVITHEYYDFHERDDILRYLDSLGVRRARLTVASRAPGRIPAPAEAFLYDLSDGERGRDLSSRTFTLVGPSGAGDCSKGRSRMVTADEIEPR